MNNNISRIFLLLLVMVSPLSIAQTLIDRSGHEVVLPEQINRVVTLSEIDLDIALALGVEPVATVNGRGQNDIPHYLRKRVKKIDVVGELARPNLEKIIALKPDIILTFELDSQVMKMLRMIAPTVVTQKPGDQWQDVLALSAKVLNRQAQAKAFMLQYEQRVMEAQTKLSPYKGQSVSIVRWSPKGPIYMFGESFANQVMKQIGFHSPVLQQQTGYSHSQVLSLEALDIIDADWLLLGTLNSNGKAHTAMETATQQPMFQRLNAYKNHHVSTVDGSYWTSIGGPLAALQVIDDIENIMLN